ncbi:MAG: MBL fold metallo-hydrolase [Clostridia bacterium]|nr:MBL fold metallo-hydrolase [Clostridia bacterium]
MATKKSGTQRTTSKSNKRTPERVAAEAARRHPKAVVAIVVILVVLIAVGAVLYFKVDKVHNAVDNLIHRATVTTDGGDKATSGGGNTPPQATTYGDKDLSFHFLELGNNYTGDSTYIKAGDVDILIDAGSRQDSADDIGDYVRNYCTDGTLEFVIATHAHQDHIAGFTNTKARDGIFKQFKCETIIDFAGTNATSAVYNNYISARDDEVEKDGAKHYTALQCAKETDGAQKTYVLGEGITMTILYQRYYEEKTSDENNYSVCVLFNHGANYYLLTGDLEAEGEASLVENNDLPEVQLFKAGHHGSYTASTDALLSVIKPKIVCVCCCCGAVEYTQNLNNTFPSQAFVNRVAPYTDKVYVTTLGTITYNETKGKYEDTGFGSMNGVITVLSSNGIVTVSCSNNDTLLKDTDWFKANRTCPTAWQTAPPG